MPTSPSDLVDARAVDVKVTDDELTVQLEDGRQPPRCRLSGTRGFCTERSGPAPAGGSLAVEVGIHRPALDEDISVEGLLAGRRSGESQQSLKRWVESRTATRPNKRMQPTARRARRG